MHYFIYKLFYPFGGPTDNEGHLIDWAAELEREYLADPSIGECPEDLKEKINNLLVKGEDLTIEKVRDAISTSDESTGDNLTSDTSNASTSLDSEWSAELEQQRLVESVQAKRRSDNTDSYQSLFADNYIEEPVVPLKPQIRQRNCATWIKENYHDGSTRQRVQNNRKPRGMSRPFNLAQYQRHLVHLLSRVLNIRTNASPFTLVIDDLNQRATPLLEEMTRRGLSRNINIVLVNCGGTSSAYIGLMQTIPVFNGSITGDAILQEISRAMDGHKDSLVIVDGLFDLVTKYNVTTTDLFNLVVGKYAATLVGVHHGDVIENKDMENHYAPFTLDVFKYLATSIITCKSFTHVLAAKVAKQRAMPEPSHGLLQGAEGIVQCLDANDTRGIVLEAEFRRKSGRPESETYFLPPALVGHYHQPMAGQAIGTLKTEYAMLLEQNRCYSSEIVAGLVGAATNEIEATFSLGLTDKQKQAREGVVLPYFDAQSVEGGEGGRILYDMGPEDDFDEEEDEI